MHLCVWSRRVWKVLNAETNTKPRLTDPYFDSTTTGQHHHDKSSAPTASTTADVDQG